MNIAYFAVALVIVNSIRMHLKANRINRDAEATERELKLLGFIDTDR